MLGAAGLGALAAACSGDDSSSGRGPDAVGTTRDTGGAGGSGASSPSCVLTPEATEGPFYIDGDLVRSDITEGRPGTPVELAITVVDADGCAPVRDAAVDIWHCDASGTYSGFEAASSGRPGGGGAPDETRYLRGTQITGADGVATFHTIYPGWYQGRAVHIHTKVHVDRATRHTGQLFFADSLNDAAYEAAPYARRGAADVRNDDDGIYSEAGGHSAEVAMTPSGNGYRGTITVGIRQR
jgi:protocatechuate 3,4-dioxygenase beta subunit